MDEQPIKLDDDGIPILEHPVDVDAIVEQPAVSGPDLTNSEIVEHLLGTERVSELINDLTDDLQKIVSWKIEEILKDQLAQLVHNATEQSGEKLGEDIRTQLQLALPELVAKIARQKPQD